MRFQLQQAENDVDHTSTDVKVLLHLPVEVNNTQLSWNI